MMMMIPKRKKKRNRMMTGSEKAMYYPFPEEELSNNPNLKGNDMN